MEAINYSNVEMGGKNGKFGEGNAGFLWYKLFFTEKVGNL